MYDFYSNSFSSTFKPFKKVLIQFETRPAPNKSYYFLIAGTIVHSYLTHKCSWSLSDANNQTTLGIILGYVMFVLSGNNHFEPVFH